MISMTMGTQFCQLTSTGLTQLQLLCDGPKLQKSQHDALLTRQSLQTVTKRCMHGYNDNIDIKQMKTQIRNKNLVLFKGFLLRF